MKKEVEVQRQILLLSDIAREEMAEKGTECLQVEKLSQKLSSQVMAIIDFTALKSQTIHQLLFGINSSVVSCVVSQLNFALCFYELTGLFILTFRSAKQTRIWKTKRLNQTKRLTPK